MRVVLIVNNIAFRNWIISGKLKELSCNDLVCTTDKYIADYIYSNYKVKVRIYSFNKYLLAAVNYFLNVMYRPRSSTSFLKGLKSYQGRLYFRFKSPLSSRVCEELIYTTGFGAEEYLMALFFNPRKELGYVNSWDNPSSRAIFYHSKVEVFVWSEFVRMSFEKFCFRSDKINVVGRLQDEDISLSPSTVHPDIEKNISTSIVYVHGGGVFAQFEKDVKSLHSHCIKMGWSLVVRGYGSNNYNFLDEWENTYLSLPSSFNKGAYGGSLVDNDLNDYLVYNFLIKNALHVVTNGSTCILDCLIFNRKAFIRLDFENSSDYILYGYFHLFVSLWKEAFYKIEDWEEMDVRKPGVQELKELKSYFLGC